MGLNLMGPIQLVKATSKALSLHRQPNPKNNAHQQGVMQAPTRCHAG